MTLKNKVALALIWLTGLYYLLFFVDIVINYYLGNTQSVLSHATTKGSQCFFSLFMIGIVILMLTMFTSILRNKEAEERT